MHPQQQPTREQAIAHFKSQIVQRELTLGFYEKQRKAKQLRFDVAALDQARARRLSVVDTELKRAELVWQAEQLEFEASTGQLDMMIVQTKLEIEHFTSMLKMAESTIVDPRTMGVSMQ